jgi:hypothetical protein
VVSETVEQRGGHDLRRAVATNLQKLGAKLEVTEAVLNHINGRWGDLAAVLFAIALDARCAHEFPSLAITREAKAREADQHHRPGRRLRYRATARGREATAGADAVVIHRYSSVQGYGSAAGDVCAGDERNAGERVNRADEIGVGLQGGGTADLPKDVGAAGAVDKVNVGVGGRRRQRAANLKNEDGIRVALTVQCQCTSEVRRRREKVDAGREGKAAQILSGQVISGRQPGGDSVRVRCVGLGRGPRIPFQCKSPEESP